MGSQRVMAASFSDETGPLDQFIGSMNSLKDEVRDTEGWPLVLVFGVSDGITETQGEFVDGGEDWVRQLNEAIACCQAAGQLYMKILEALP